MATYGRFQVPESMATIPRQHQRTATYLNVVDHEPAIGVLDQEDLIAQGIDTSTLVPGAQKVNALGSCTANAFVSALANLMAQKFGAADALSEFQAATRLLLSPDYTVSDWSDVVDAERFAIRFYHGCSDQTGMLSREWPPADTGSSGPFVEQYAKRLGLASDAYLAHGATNIVSLMQTGGLLTGSPWYNAWETPDANGFIDGDGSPAAYQVGVRSGVAGGHETYWSAIEKLTFTATGAVTPTGTIIRGRNSWSKSWGDNGSYRAHLSTFVQLGQYCDHRQLVA